MPNRARMALCGAAAGIGLLFLTWFAAFHIGVVERADESILRGFAGLHRPRVDRVTTFIAHLCDPHRFVVLAALPVLVALIRRRPRVAVAVGLILLGANVTTQLLKPLLAVPRPAASAGLVIQAASWPSGHATAAMSLALCAVLAAPARWRPVVGAAMAAFAVAVCYSFLELGWHYPSDVLGGFLVASTWALLGAAAIYWLEERRPAPRPEPGSGAAPVSVGDALAPVAILVGSALLLAAVVALARPHAVLAYAAAHTAFVIGAAAIAVLGLSIATAAALALRR